MKKILITIIALFFSVITFADNKIVIEANSSSANSSVSSTLNNYSQVLSDWKTEGLRDDLNFSRTFIPTEFRFEVGSLTSNTHDYKDFSGSSLISRVYDFSEAEEFEVDVLVIQTGLYQIGIDYYSTSTTIRDIQLEVAVNDEIQYHEAGQITLKNLWETPHKFNLDRYKNDIMPKATLKEKWVNEFFKDTPRLQPEDLFFKLDSGINTIKIKRNYGTLLVGRLFVRSKEELISYKDYLKQYPNQNPVNDVLKTVEAENPLYRNDLSIKYGTDRHLKVTPFALMENKLNIIDGNSYKKAGQAIAYEFEVAKAGFYYLTFKIKQEKAHSKVFRTLYVNGKIPFKEAKEIGFKSASKWTNVTIGDEIKNYLIYLEKGINEIALEVNASPFLAIYETVENAMASINELSLMIKKLSGGDTSSAKDWELEENIPNLTTTLNDVAYQLELAYEELIAINESKKNTEILVNLKKSAETLRYFSRNPNKIPHEINKFSVGNSSILQKLGLILPLIIEQPLAVDKLYLHNKNAKLPSVKANFLQSFWIGVKRFFLSFFSDRYDEKADKDEVEVWVNRSRQYVHLMQQMVDDDFTKNTGIKVKISIMPNEDKLILATSSNTQPDVALGVAGWRPYDFAIRNALIDLTKLPGFYEVASNFEPGAFAQLIYQEGIYGLPETQNFMLLFYRKDILNNISIEIPDTWQDVLNLLPELQRYGLNFYSPLSTSTAFKAYVHTMPFINQFGGQLYTADLLKSNLTDPNTILAINFMSELYTIYSLPVEVGSFYNQFRYGTLPLGIGDFGMYVQLLHAAPEIAGLWDIAPLPGVKDSNDFVNRSYDGASTSAIIFKNSKKINQSWQFLKWWTSQEVQLDYAENLITSLGPEYMWNTSNVAAFKDYSWDENHKQVILEQWKHVFDTPKTPASYMMEREISNIWNKVVFDGENTRIAISDSEIIIDKEITKKMIEFNYINQKNEIIKPYLFPTKETILRWVSEDE